MMIVVTFLSRRQNPFFFKFVLRVDVGAMFDPKKEIVKVWSVWSPGLRISSVRSLGPVRLVWSRRLGRPGEVGPIAGLDQGRPGAS